MRLKDLEIRDPLPRTVGGWWDWIHRHTTCKLGRHSHPKRQVHKFNGGNTCWLCKYCRLIVRYDSLSHKAV
jgi:hypothetical protein